VGGKTIDNQSEPRSTARAKLRPKSQLTVPEEIRRALHVAEGDEVEFAVHENGLVTVRGYVSIPTDQVWLFAPQVQAGRQQANAEIITGQGTVYESADDMFGHLETLGAADA
jgi:bifunctional DNA-binding transcriptional regulator/antitoxin component of YhaV-PrlF toxin-antitoxin module